MFDAILLDSSPERVPVLDRRHWMGAFGVGVLGGLAGFLLLPLMFSPSPEGRLVESILIGVAVMFYELMLLFVLSDARHLGMNAGRWSIVLLVLNIAGFMAYLAYSAYKTGDWKRATLPLAYMLEVLVVCMLLLVPLIYTQALPDSRWNLATIPPPGLGTPKGRIHARSTNHTRPPIDTKVNLIFPQPFKLHSSGTGAATPSEVSGDPVFGGVQQIGDIVGVPFGQTIGEGMPALPKPVDKPPHPTRVFKSSSVEEAKLIFGPKPAYPRMAILTRTQGTVEMKAIISKDGTIQELKEVSGSPLLIQAAVDAVSRWRYQPTLLNGEPVEVVTDISVNFILSEQ